MNLWHLLCINHVLFFMIMFLVYYSELKTTGEFEIYDVPISMKSTTKNEQYLRKF